MMEQLAGQTPVLMAFAVLATLLLVLFLLFAAGQRRTKNELRRLADQMELQEDQQEERDARQRELLVTNLHQMHDSLVTTFSGFNRSQGEQVNAALRQCYENTQAADERQHSMQRMVDDSIKRLETRMQGVEESRSRELTQNADKLESFRKTLDDGLRMMREDNHKQLADMRQTVDEKLSETLEKRLNASFAQVSERLEQVYKSLGEVHSLASGVGDLKRVLTNVKSRGVWGEIQLGAILAEAMTESQYQRNVAVVPGSPERVEFAVCLPGKDEGARPVYLPIDSKFPQEDYARLREAADAGDPAAVEAAQKALMNAVKTEAKRIGKYIVPPRTTDFAVMFLPLESLYAEVMSHSDVAEAIQREQRVLIAGPSTLLALLNSLQMGFRTLAIEQRSAEVWKLLGAVKHDFGKFASVLEKTQEKLQQASSTIDTAFAQTRSIEKRLRSVEALELSDADEAEEKIVAPISKPEA